MVTTMLITVELDQHIHFGLAQSIHEDRKQLLGRAIALPSCTTFIASCQDDRRLGQNCLRTFPS
jgi:hypothetical protein